MTARKRITKTVVDAAKPSAKRYIVWDTAIAGFGLLVLPTGVKSYVYQYRNKHGDSRRATIGKHGDWTADQARRKAEDWRDGLKHGTDPLAEKRAAKDALTVGELLDLYLASEKFAAKAESTRAIDKGRIERHLRPLLGKKYAEQLTSETVRRTFVAIRDGKTATTVKTKAHGLARVTGGEGTARGAVRLLRAVITWAMSEKVLPRGEHPCDGVDIGTDGERDIILDDVDAYKRLFSTLDTMERERRIRGPVADAIRLIALTGCRRGEAAGLQWKHVKGNRLELPPRRHKSGRKIGKPRIIGLPTAAQEIIARQESGQPDDPVFKPADGKGVIDLSHPWRDVRTEAKLPEGIGLHGLRHSVGSHLAMAGAGEAELMTALGHRQIGTTVRYIHWAERQRSTLAEKAASVAMAGLVASGGKQKGAVSKMPRKRGAR